MSFSKFTYVEWVGTDGKRLLFLGDDAKEAVKHGLDGILVSNHGARQLDGVPATVSYSPHQDFSLEF